MKYLSHFLLALAGCAFCCCRFGKTPPLLFVGTYTEDLGFVQGKASGIYTCRFDPASGALTVIDSTTDIANPSFLALSPDQRFLFAVAENGGKPNQPYGSVAAYRIGPGGHLNKINEVPSYGVAPCHIAIDASGRYVLVANYTTGNVVSYLIGADGALSDSVSSDQHPGKLPRAHMIIPIPRQFNRVLAVDKGGDQVYFYRFDDGVLNRTGSLYLAPGAGPRHFDFHPTDPALGFVINENSSSLASVRLDEDGLGAIILDSLSTLPAGFQGNNTCADIHVHPNGRFVYGSNRGHNSIVIFGIERATGKLSLVGHESTQGAVPRNFMLTPDGNWLLVANQNSDVVVAFRIDPKTGKLTPAGQSSRVLTPVCLRYYAE